MALEKKGTGLDKSHVPISNTLERLGVIIDGKMNFESHIAKIHRKVSQKIAVLKGYRNCCP